MPLMQRHWTEIDGDGPFDPDWHRLFALAQAGALLIFTARRGATLVGYVSFTVVNDLSSRRRVCAFAENFWLSPIERTGWTGYRLLRDCEPELKKKGVNRLYVSPKIDFCNDRGQTVAVILKRLRYRPVEVRHVKMLGDRS